MVPPNHSTVLSDEKERTDACNDINKSQKYCDAGHKRYYTICLYLFFHQNLLFSFQNCFSKSDKSNLSRFSLGLTSKVVFFPEDINHTDFLRLFSLNLTSLNSDNMAE